MPKQPDTLYWYMRTLNLWPVLIPLWIVGACVCYNYRYDRWIAPFWLAIVPPVFILYGTIIGNYVIGAQAKQASHAFAMSVFFGLISAPELIPGTVLLLMYPRGKAWSIHAILPCLAAPAISIPVFYLMLRFAPTMFIKYPP